MLPETTPTRNAQRDFEDVDPDTSAVSDIWDMTPVMKHFWQAGCSMGRNPLALVAVVLARVLAMVDPAIQLPGVRDGAIGRRNALNLGVALVGASGQGKTSYIEESTALLLGDPHAQDDITGKPSTASTICGTPPQPTSLSKAPQNNNSGRSAAGSRTS